MSASGHTKVSVVVPVFNAESTIKETLDSVLMQALDNVEIICVDDGSTDSSADILDRLSAENSTVKVLSQPNSGVSAARNAGIDAASGEFITFIDADDMYAAADHLKVLYEGAKQNGQLAAASSFASYRGANNIVSEFLDPLFDGYGFDEPGVIEYSDYQFDYGFHRFIFAKSLFDNGENRFPELVFFEDPVFLATILRQAGSFFGTPDARYLYREDHKPIKWTTPKTLDLLEGVKRNLAFSSENRLAKLHWYTAHHFDDTAYYIGTGIDSSLNIEQIDAKLKELESEIDRELLKTIDPEDAGYVPLMRKRIDGANSRSAAQNVIIGKAFSARNALAPAYHKIKTSLKRK